MSILFLITVGVMAVLLFWIVGSRAVIGSLEPTPRRVAVVGYGASLNSTVIALVWLVMWRHIPPAHPDEYWKFLALAVAAFVACFIAFGCGLLSRGTLRLRIVGAGVVMGASSLLITLLSIRFS
jgi:hypothetical protein